MVRASSVYLHHDDRRATKFEPVPSPANGVSPGPELSDLSRGRQRLIWTVLSFKLRTWLTSEQPFEHLGTSVLRRRG